MAGAPSARLDRNAAIRRVFLGLLVANLAVVSAKVVIGLKAGSLAVLGDAVHSSVDGLNNIIFIALMQVAGRAADDDHPYGHSKFEVLGGLGIVVFLCVACFELLKQAVLGLLRGAEPPTFSRLDLGLLALTLVTNIWVAQYEARRGRQLASDLLLADAAHTRADVFITVGVLVGAVLARQGIRYIDQVVAIGVGVLIAHTAWEIFMRAMPTLVDQVAREPLAIRRSAESVDGVQSAYSIRSRSAAGIVFAELTIGVPGDLAVRRAHAIADEVEERLKRELQLDEVVVHIEPC
jgi:cation diffusion facilitator family transporter